MLDLILTLVASESSAKAIQETPGPLNAFVRLHAYLALNEEKPAHNILLHLLECMRCISFWVASGLTIARYVNKTAFYLMAVPLVAWRSSRFIYDYVWPEDKK